MAARASKTVELAYQPRGPFLAFHKRHQTRAVLVCHRRAGKTVATIHDLVFKALATRKPNAFFAYVAPYKTQCKQIAWEYLVRAVNPFGSHVKIDKQELSVKLPNGSTIRLFGADDPDSFRGLYMDGVVLDEYGDMKPKVYTEVIAPALADRRGWVVFIGTPKGHNNFYDVRELARKDPASYFYLELKASESGFLAEDVLLEQREQMSPSEYQQEFECSFEASLQGSFYADQVAAIDEKGRIGSVPHVRDVAVNTAWDLGMADATAIWFYQIVAGELRIIDYLEISRTPLFEIVELLREKPYEYGVCWLPHDAAHDNLQTGKSIREDLWEAGFDARVIPKLSVRSGINAVRKALPHCWFDKDKCYLGLECLKMYSKTWSKSDSRFIETPKHDKYSHGADAFRYLSISIRDHQLAEATAMPQITNHVPVEKKAVLRPKEVLYTLPPPSQFAVKRRARV